MSLFDKLPVVNKCCFCVDLKLGNILIAIWGIIHASIDISLFVIPKICKSSEGPYAMLLKIATYLCSVTTLLFLISCIIFLIGIFMHQKVTAMLFLYCNFLSLLTYAFFYITAILVTFFEKDCEVKIFLVSVLIDLILWTHFLIVVRSYKDEMN